MDGLREFVHEHNGKSPAEWFMALYGKFGNPQEGGIWSYLLRHNNVVMRVTAEDNERMEYDVWVSPAFVLDARRKRKKAVNIIARRLNENGVVFVPSAEDRESLYYGVRVKNDFLKQQQGLSEEKLTDNMYGFMSKKEAYAINGDISQYMEGAKGEIVRTIKEIFDEAQS